MDPLKTALTKVRAFLRKATPTQRLGIGIFTLLVVLPLTFRILFYSPHNGHHRGPAPVIVESPKVEKLSETLEAIGTLKANESLTITAKIAETIEKIHFEEGEMVEKDALLITLTQAEEQAQKEAALATVAENERELKRLKPLVKKKLTSARSYDERKTKLEVSKREAREIEAKLKDRTITAPFAGVVGLRQKSEGALVNPGDEITTLDDISQMKVDFSVPEVFLENLKNTQEISGQVVAFPDKTFKGKIHKIDTRVDPNTRAVMVRALFENSDKLLKPGMQMNINLYGKAVEQTTIPESALLTRGNKTYIYLAVKKKGQWVAQEKEIQLARRGNGWVVVTTPLTPEDKVIARGLIKVREGAPILLQETPSYLGGKAVS